MHVLGNNVLGKHSTYDLRPKYLCIIRTILEGRADVPFDYLCQHKKHAKLLDSSQKMAGDMTSVAEVGL